ncbi:MAG: PucR family transcriptional regulator [Micromonosporaceae bacterium]
MTTLLDMPDLQLRLLVGKEEVDREIRWVYTTDLRDPRRYLSGGELVLTGLVWWRTPEDSEPFVSALADAGVAGLAAGYGGTGLAAVPDDLLTACRRHRLPLIEVPEAVSFATITERVLSAVVTLSGHEASALLGLHRKLHTASGDAAGVAGICELLAEKLGHGCWVLSATGKVVAGDDPPTPDERRPLARRALATEQPVATMTLRGGRTYSLLPTAWRAPYRATGWVLVVADDAARWPNEWHELATEAASLIGLQQARMDDQGRLRDELAVGLVRLTLTEDPVPAEVGSRLEMVGFRPDEPLAVLSASAAGGAPELLRGVLAELLGPICERVAIAPLDGETIALAPVDLGRLADTVGALQAGVTALEPGLGGVRLAIGVSAAAASGQVLRRAIDEARYARRLAEHRAGTGNVVSSEELASHAVLLTTVPEELRRSFRSRLLGPLLEYDAGHQSDLVRTLTVFLECSGSWTRCAARLHLHVNTLRYRITRIEQLTGRDLASFPDRVDLYLALRLR